MAAKIAISFLLAYPTASNYCLAAFARTFSKSQYSSALVPKLPLRYSVQDSLVLVPTSGIILHRTFTSSGRVGLRRSKQSGGMPPLTRSQRFLSSSNENDNFAELNAPSPGVPESPHRFAKSNFDTPEKSPRSIMDTIDSPPSHITLTPERTKRDNETPTGKSQNPPLPSTRTSKRSKYFSSSSSDGSTQDEHTFATPNKSSQSSRKSSEPPSAARKLTPDTNESDDPTCLSATPPKKTRKSPQSKQSSPRKKRVKIEPGSLDPPKDWEKIYSLVEELRADRTAPVDSEGGGELPEKHLGKVVHRYQVLVALMLSSQTKDAVVGETMRSLQRHGLTVENIHATDHETLNALIRKVGFHNNKTKYLKESAEIILTQYKGDIPPTANEMMTLPGVGPKMAFIVESIAFNTTSGIGVDTHMHRIFNDLKWVNSTNPEQTREQLEGWLPKDKWAEINVLFVGFGQEVTQQKEKMLKKALVCSSPREALGLIQKLRMDVKKEGKRYNLSEDIERVMNATK